MTFDDALSLVTPQRFTRIDTGHGTSAVIPLCSHPQCSKPLRKFNEAIWATLEEWDLDADPIEQRFELRAFCRTDHCDLFHNLQHDLRKSGLKVHSCWHELAQLWCSDQRSVMELGVKEWQKRRGL